METNGPTGYEKRNRSNVPHRRLQVHRTGWKHYALNISGTFRHRKLKFYIHLDRFNHNFWVRNFFRQGVQGAQHPLVKIWDTVYISETIRARKSKILQALRYALVACENFSARGRIRGAAPPNVNLGPHHIPSYLRNYQSWKVEILHTLRQDHELTSRP